MMVKKNDSYALSSSILHSQGLGEFQSVHLNIVALKVLDKNFAGAVGEQWKGTLSDPMFYLGFSITLYGKGNSGKQQGPSSSTPMPIQEKFGESFTRRHNASKVSTKSHPKDNNTVGTRGVHFQEDLKNINEGNATIVPSSQYERVYKLENGSSYFVKDGVLKPLSGPRFVNLTRNEFKILGLLNTEGVYSKSIWSQYQLGIFTPQQIMKAYNVYLNSRK